VHPLLHHESFVFPIKTYRLVLRIAFSWNCKLQPPCRSFPWIAPVPPHRLSLRFFQRNERRSCSGLQSQDISDRSGFPRSLEVFTKLQTAVRFVRQYLLRFASLLLGYAGQLTIIKGACHEGFIFGIMTMILIFVLGLLFAIMSFVSMRADSPPSSATLVSCLAHPTATRFCQVVQDEG